MESQETNQKTLQIWLIKMIAASTFVQNKKYFPIKIFSGLDEILITKRPKVGLTEIFDIRVNNSHQGMLCGVEHDVLTKTLTFGPMGITKAYMFRNILRYSFVKLLEYYGLDDVEKIVVAAPEDLSMLLFLKNLDFEFLKKNKKYILDLAQMGIETFVEKLNSMDVEIQDRTYQLETVLTQILNDKEEAKLKTQKIVRKIKEMNPLTETFWDLKAVHEINMLLSAAALNPERIIALEFAEQVLKTMMASFEVHLIEPYFEEAMATLAGDTQFHIDYFNRVLKNLKEITPQGVKEVLDAPEHMQKWIAKNLPIWEKRVESKKNFLEQKKLRSRLTKEDFGESIPPDYAGLVESLINHYNGDIVLYGMSRKM